MAPLIVKYVASLSELPSNDRSIMVIFGKTDAQVQEGERIMILVNPDPLSDQLAQLRLKIATEAAKTIARREGIENVYVCETLVRQ